MFGSIKSMVVAFAVTAGLFAVGCTSTNTPQSSLAPTDKGMTCTKCQVTWVQEPVSNGKRVTGYQWAKKDICPDCRDAVQSFFASGKFDHTCKTCGDSLQICEAHAH